MCNSQTRCLNAILLGLKFPDFVRSNFFFSACISIPHLKILRIQLCLIVPIGWCESKSIAKLSHNGYGIVSLILIASQCAYQTLERVAFFKFPPHRGGSISFFALQLQLQIAIHQNSDVGGR
jgi:hypothetical protein